MMILAGILFLTLIAFSGSVQAHTRSLHSYAVTPPSPLAFASCIYSAAHAYRVPPQAITSIMSVEGGHQGQAVGPNINGTYDLGLMQVNSRWVPQLAQIWHVNYRTAYAALRDNNCENIYVGTWILKQNIAGTGSLSSGIAHYHSATRGLGGSYADKVALKMRQQAPILYAAQ